MFTGETLWGDAGANKLHGGGPVTVGKYLRSLRHVHFQYLTIAFYIPIKLEKKENYGREHEFWTLWTNSIFTCNETVPTQGELIHLSGTFGGFLLPAEEIGPLEN